MRLLRCCCPGTCDDGIVGNFFCESLHWDGGDCLVEDACGDTGECSMCGGHWDAVSTDRMPSAWSLGSMLAREMRRARVDASDQTLA